MQFQNQYPVILICMKDLKNRTYEMQIRMFSLLIQEIAMKFSFLTESDALTEIEKKRLNKLLYENADESELQLAIKFLTQCLCHHFHKKVILLIDEYDVPLQSAYLHGYYDKMVIFLGNVFSSSLKTNDYLEKGILTGCLRIARESIFTGLNNFSVYSVLDETASSCFGFTQDEVNDLLSTYQLSAYSNLVKSWYNGYLFGNTEIYNPWSILKYVNKTNREAGDGRFDLVIYGETIDDPCIVIECKHSETMRSLKADSERAARHIIDKRYINEILNEGYLQCIGYGIAFCKKSCLITSVSSLT